MLPSLPNNVWCKQRSLERAHLQYVHKENKQAEMRCCLYGIFCMCGIQACVVWMWSRTYIARCLLEIRSMPLIVKIPVMNLSEKNISNQSENTSFIEGVWSCHFHSCLFSEPPVEQCKVGPLQIHLSSGFM